MKFLLACALAPLAILTAPAAAADVNIGGFNIGSQGNAHATFGNVAVALGPNASATAEGGVANFAYATGDSWVVKQGPGSFNVLTANGRGINQSAVNVVNTRFTVASALRGGQVTGNGANGTVNVAFGRSNIKPSTVSTVNTDLSVQVAVCGGSVLSSQGDRVNIGAPCVGIGH